MAATRASGDDRVLLGAITGARGLKGEVKIKSFTDDPAAIGDYGPLADEAGARTFKVKVTGTQKGTISARIEGVADRNTAEALKGTRLYVARHALPAPAEDEFYFADLIGLEARDGSGAVVGRVDQVFDHGAGAFLEVSDPAGGKAGLTVPFTKACVPVVDVKGGYVQVNPPEDVVVPPDVEVDAEEPENG